MIYKEFQDLKLSALGMGCMRLPVLDGGRRPGWTRPATAARWWTDAMASGVNYYDTAWGYHSGNSEIALGKALAKHPREQLLPGRQVPRLRLGQHGQGGGDLRGAAEEVPGGLL